MIGAILRHFYDNFQLVCQPNFNFATCFATSGDKLRRISWSFGLLLFPFLVWLVGQEGRGMRKEKWDRQSKIRQTCS